MRVKAKKLTIRDANEFFLEGLLTLSEMSENGVRIDLEYLNSAVERVRGEIRTLRAELHETKVAVLWRNKYGGRENTYNSGKKLGHILFEVLGHKCPKRTATGQYSTDDATLSKVKEPFCEKFLKIKKLTKTLDTYLLGILRETDESGFVHASFKLASGKEESNKKGGARSYRGSCADPNLNNMPIRNKAMAALIRPCFIARDGDHHIAEVDYKQLEVCINAAVTGDPQMIRYVTDPKSDMHLDTSCDVLMCKPAQVTKEIRNIVKNGFVFPEFYGDYFSSCAKALWPRLVKLALADGTPVRDHLRRKGVRRLGPCNPRDEQGYSPEPGTFEGHLQKVENTFWNVRFKHTTQTKRERWARYKERGWFDMLTGFVCGGEVFRHNQVVNFDTQGPAFHCLLLACTEVNKEFRRRGMRSLLICEIHDCVMFDLYAPERQRALDIIHRVMTETVRERWPWIIVPLVVEVSVAPKGKSWHEKLVWEKLDGKWQPKPEKA